uniref:flagellar protein FlaG n=1 Tax=Thaumasiovibrio occultus TaxID=1891184 RepID=UPI000B3576F2|nr:flagellar protein FlaG [Thaumasiovibrio occultus]
MDIKSISSSAVSGYTSTGTERASGTNVASNINHAPGHRADNAAALSRSLEQTRTQHAGDAAELHTQRVEQTSKLEQQQQVQREQLEAVVEQMEAFVSSLNKGLSFRIDEESGRSIVTVYEVTSGDIVRQIPNEEMLELSKRIAEYHHGGLMSTQV